MSDSRKQHNEYQQNVFEGEVDFYRQAIPDDVQKRTEKIVAAASLTSADRVLDIGTGRGVLIPYIKRHNVSAIVGCDLTQAMLNDAQSLYPDVTFWRGDFIDFPQTMRRFNAIFFNAMFANIWDQRLSLEKALSLLDTGGCVVLSHPMGSGFVRQLKQQDPKLIPNSYPDKQQAKDLIAGLPFMIQQFRDDPLLYICVLEKFQE